MTIYRLSDTLYISPQLTEKSIEQVTQLGIQTLIANRPDEEENNQPSFAQVQQLLEKSSIQNFIFQPLTMPEINSETATQFAQFASQTPTLAYCRTGTRCSLLWAITQVQNGMDIDETIQYVYTASEGNIDLSVQRAKLEAAQSSIK